MRRRLPPPARRPALWAELLRHFRTHGGRLTLLDPPCPSFTAAPSLAGGNAVAGHRAGRCSIRGRASLAGAVRPVLTGYTGVVNRMHRSTVPLCILIFQNS